MNKSKKWILLTFICIQFWIISCYTEEQQEYIHLDFNENPYGCFPSIKEAMTNSLNLSAFYPDEQRIKLISEIAAHHSVDSKQILVSNGLASLLFIIADALVDKKTKIITPDPTFEFFMQCAKRRGGEIVQVPLNSDYSHDLDAMLEAVDENTKIVLICNPNNPTGTITPREKIDRFLEKLPTQIYVIIDEAYHQFGKESSAYLSYLDKPSERAGVIVGRTFSKVYGMAGIRMGYIISSKETIQLLSNYYDVDNNNVAALCGASAALKDETALEEVIANYAITRNEFYKQLEERKLSYILSHTCFVMFNLAGRDPRGVRAHFKNHGILIGKSYPAIPGYIRVSLGLPSQMKRFWDVWDILPNEN